MFQALNFTEKDSEAQKMMNFHFQGLILFNSKDRTTMQIFSGFYASHSMANIMGHVSNISSIQLYVHLLQLFLFFLIYFNFLKCFFDVDHF